MAAFTTIDDAGLFFNTVLYTGTDTSGTGTVTGVGFQPDLVWGKVRSKVGQHNLYDAVRGGGKRLIPNGGDATETNAAYGYLSAFDSDGFTTTAGSTNNENWNETSETFASWNWKMGTTSGISGGTITPSAYSFNTTAGQSIIAYTGTGSAATVPHGLGVAPKVVLVKKLSAVEDWTMLNMNISGEAEKYMVLNTTQAVADSTTTFNDTDPTSTVFSVGTAGSTNGSASTYVAYCWADIQGFSKFGNYEGTGNADGPFIYTGFRPAFIMNKRTDSTAAWKMHNNKVPLSRGNVCNLGLSANTTAAESAVDGPDRQLDFLANGFKWRAVDTDVNYDGSDYIYMAFAESPFVNSEGVPSNAR
jgi:hypothetical protein